MRIFIIANPNAGGFKKISAEKIKSYLEERGAEVTLRLTTKRGDASDFAAAVKSDEYDVVVAAGGDGTLNEVINGIAGRGITFGLIPMGTVNVVALETEIPFDPYGACDVLLKNKPQKVSLGRVDGMYFILMLSAGFDALVAYKVHGGLKSFLGKFAYMLQGILMLFTYKFPKITVTAAGKRYKGYSVIISNMKLYAGKGIIINPDASFFEDDLQACVLRKKGPLAILRFLFHVIFRTQHRFKELTYFRAKEITLESESRCSIQADGDAIGVLPKKVTIAKGALDILLP